MSYNRYARTRVRRRRRWMARARGVALTLAFGARRGCDDDFVCEVCVRVAGRGVRDDAMVRVMMHDWW